MGGDCAVCGPRRKGALLKGNMGRAMLIKMITGDKIAKFMQVLVLTAFVISLLLVFGEMWK